MSDTIPTVKIKDDKAPGGYVVINEEDFDEKTQTLYVEPKHKAEAPAEDATPAAKRRVG